MQPPRATPDQQKLCARFGVEPDPPIAASNVGIALRTHGVQPLNALRHRVEHGSCGWYLWWGESLSDDPTFFSPVCVEHLAERCADLLPYLALPPGWRVQLAPGHEDVWFDPALLLE